VSLKETSANVFIKVQSEVIVKMFDSLLSMWSLRTVINALTEQVCEPLQRVLIHGIYNSEVNDCEEEDRCAVSDRSVNFSSLIDLLLGYF
jgi:hypothetical protein